MSGAPVVGLPDGPIDVFISYAREDRAAAEQLQALLEAPPHNLWSFLPELARLAARHSLAHLADPAFRARLADGMRASNMPALDTLSVEQQREYARQYILQVERKQQTPAAEPSADSNIPDALVHQMLADADFRQILEGNLKEAKLPALDALDPDQQRQFARIVLKGLIEQQAKAQSEAAAEGRPQPTADHAPTPSAPAPATPAKPAAAKTPEPSKPRGVFEWFFGRYTRRS